MREQSGAGSAADTVVYELCNVFGTPTGRRVALPHGEPLPAVPKGWSWQVVTA